ncbi:MAG: hypothetical protein EOO88_48350, partial [Pedobacter sp.]
PYTELNYMLASKAEQVIELLHTQNIKPNWNMMGSYRLIAAPGYFNNQKTSHSNYVLSSRFESVNKRYNNYFAIVANKLQASENGGISDATNYLQQSDYSDRFTIPTKIGGDSEYGTNFFSTEIGTGNRYRDFTVMMRQQYDFGRKDSLVTDSTVIPLFYPRLRFEHSIQYSTRTYQFLDEKGDSVYYSNTYDIRLPSAVDTLRLTESWRELVNDFSIYQFPDAKNLHQFIKVGASIQTLKGVFLNGNASLYNVFGHAEYRNRTRNQRWDFIAKGVLYFTGYNAGDYHAYGSLQSSLGKQIGTLQVGFENVNRTPSFIFDNRSSFYLASVQTFKKENSSHLFAGLNLTKLRLLLDGHYYLATNYTYFTGFYQPNQSSSLFNLLQVSAKKNFKFGKQKRLNLYTDIYVQQKIGNAPINVPLVFTRVRFAYEGNLGFKNLDAAIGVEGRYHTAYKADDYSPILGQFQYQDTLTIRN